MIDLITYNNFGVRVMTQNPVVYQEKMAEFSIGEAVVLFLFSYQLESDKMLKSQWSEQVGGPLGEDQKLVRVDS
jgi:hypothetical protein